jgi:selenocysteine-specific elongation factor
MAERQDTSDGTRDGTVVNVNVGVLGHVDSGKTHLVRVLSTHLSTAALDKHPQSQQRGMTLDLGFSAFRVASPVPNGPELQITLVDCPGHASLFKTILGGVHIIDAVLLVVDIQKGLQPQTIECLLLAQLAVASHIVVALNKIDLVPEQDLAKRIACVEREIREFLTRNFKLQDPQPNKITVVPVAAAAPGQAEGEAAKSVGITDLVQAIRAALPMPTRDSAGPLCFAIDHCFAIQGNGTILTGTVLSGCVRVGDKIELPALQAIKKVKSMQMFKQSVQSAIQGDRIALRVNGLDASLVERGVAVTPHSLPFVSQVIVRVHQIPLFRSECKTGAKIHATIGHTTVVAVATFFQSSTPSSTAPFVPTSVYRAVRQVDSVSETREDVDLDTANTAFEGFALLQFEQPVICPPNAAVVCSRFDLDPKRFHCRLAFHGAVEAIVWDNEDDAASGSGYSATRFVASHSLRLGDLRIGNVKERSGVVDKPVQTTASTLVTEVLARDMFAKDVDWLVYAGTTVLFEQSKRLGKILGPFGKSGKFRVELLSSSRQQVVPASGEKLVLRFIKLLTLRPLKRAKPSNRTGGKSTGSVSAGTNSNINNATRKLLQDDQVLYPEAFEADKTPVERDDSATSLTPAPPLPVPEIADKEPRVRGRIERLKGETTADHRNPFVIVTGLFSDEASASAASGRSVRCLLSQSVGDFEIGEIEKPFGKAGKVRVVFKAHGGTLGQVGDVIELL